MSRPPLDSVDPFAGYHRARRASVAVRAALVGVPTALAVAGLVAIGSMSTAAAAPASSIAKLSPPTPHTPSAPKALPAPGPVVTAPKVSTPVVVAASLSHITITATGYQAELDRCQWVRMDLGIPEPIVGAHTECGGSVVLTMRQGDLVQLTGQGLDGTYVVTTGRDAHAGEDAATATDGMDASVILQTCYPGTGGRERLIGLEYKS